jgi:hypothetical protein
MKIPVYDAGGELANLTDMRTKGFPPRLFRKPLWDRHNRDEDGGGYSGRDDEHITPKLAWRG